MLHLFLYIRNQFPLIFSGATFQIAQPKLMVAIGLQSSCAIPLRKLFWPFTKAARREAMRFTASPNCPISSRR